jgi:UDP-glucose 4-epimerase
MKLIIIGSQGFIGSHAYAYFSATDEVWGADVIDLAEQKNFILLEKDHTDFGKIFKGRSFDVCINASGNGNVSKSLEDPQYDYELNVFNTFKMLESIRQHNPACRFINFSSAAVYGNPSVLPVAETSTLNPISPYGWHKLYTENICQQFFKLFGIQSISLRIFSVYGEFLRKQLFWDIYHKTLRSRHIELFGTGNETRDFIYINDLLKALSCIIKNGRFEAQSINVASGTETSIRQASSLFCQELGEDIKITFNNISKPGDPLKWRADISLLLYLGFCT